MKIDRSTVWLFDLDNTLHDAGSWVFGALRESMGAFTARELALSPGDAQALNLHYWHRYGASLLGLMRHHGVRPTHFLRDTHHLPELESRVNGHRHDLAALARLPGRKLILTNAPRAYALRVLDALQVAGVFDAVIAIDDMRMFGQLRPKPDARMLRWVVRGLGVSAGRCVLVEDTLVHQKAARGIGMRTVWMQRFIRGGASLGPAARGLAMRPPYVDRRVRRLSELLR